MLTSLTKMSKTKQKFSFKKIIMILVYYCIFVKRKRNTRGDLGRRWY